MLRLQGCGCSGLLRVLLVLSLWLFASICDLHTNHDAQAASILRRNILQSKEAGHVLLSRPVHVIM